MTTTSTTTTTTTATTTTTSDEHEHEPDHDHDHVHDHVHGAQRSATERRRSGGHTSNSTRPARITIEPFPALEGEPPDVSIIIPVHNEEGILSASLSDLRDKLADVDYTYEIILAENGSTDRTVQIANEFRQRHAEVRVLSIGEANYGRALKQGILRARGEFVVCDEIDLCDVVFHQEAIGILRTGRMQLVVGSKSLPGSLDYRPRYRRLATRVLNAMLRLSVGFRGTDTHGLKAFRREDFLAIVNACVVEKDIFASEFVIRSQLAERRWMEIPVDLVEKRPPSTHLFRRVPNVLRNMARLTMIIRLGRDLE